MDVEAELLAEGDVEGVGGKVSETLDEARLQNWRASDSALESWSEHWEETQPTRSRGKFPFAQKQDTSVMVEQFTCETASARQLLTQAEYVLKLGNDVVVREPVAIPLVSERTDVTVVENVLVPLGPMLVVSTVAMLVAAEDVSAVSDDDGPVDVEGMGTVKDAERLGLSACTEGFVDALTSSP